MPYFIISLPMRNCLGKHSCMSIRFPVAILSIPAEACSVGTGTVGLFGRATLVRPCKCATWRQFYLTNNPLFGRATKDEQLFDWLLSGKQMKTVMRIVNLLG